MALTVVIDCYYVIDDNDKYDGIKFEFSVHTFLFNNQRKRDSRFDVKYDLDAF